MFRRKIAIIVCFIISVCFVLAAYAADPVPVNSITLDKTEITVAVGKAISLKAALEPKNASVKKLEWASSDETVATVNNNGNVKGIAVGTAVITAKATDDSGAEASAVVTVIQEVKKVTAVNNKLVLAPGVTWKPEIMIEPADATIQKLAWTSSNDKVANVDENGEISAIAVGSSNIVGVTTDGSNRKVTISLQVKEHDVLILTPKEVHVDFETRYDSYGSYLQVGGWSHSETEEIIVAFKDGYVCEGSAEHTLRPLKPGSGVVEVAKKHNGRNSGKNTYTVFVAQDAVPIEGDDEIGRMEAETYEGHTYQVFYSGRSWEEAEKFCEKHNGHLVTITSDKEQKFLERYLAKAEKKQSYWIGLNSGKNKQFTKWITGEALKYSKWMEGNPDGNEPSNNCARIAASEYSDENGWTMKRGTWDDVGGTYFSIVGFICEWDLENSPNVLPPMDSAAKTSEGDAETAEVAPFAISAGEASVYGQELVLNAGTEKESVFTGYFIPSGKYSVTNQNADKAIKISVYQNVRQTIEGTEEFKKAKDKEAVMLFPGKSGELAVVEDEFILFSDEEFSVSFEPSVPAVSNAVFAEDAAVYNGHAYKVFREPVPWPEAKARCEAVGGHLVTITSEEEQHFVEQLCSDGEMWIGLRRVDDESFAWVTGEEISYTYWGDGEPNNYWLEEFPGENSAAMRPDWNDYHENNLEHIVGYVCEWETD